MTTRSNMSSAKWCTHTNCDMAMQSPSRLGFATFNLNLWCYKLPTSAGLNRAGTQRYVDLPLCDTPSIAEADDKELWLFERQRVPQ